MNKQTLLLAGVIGLLIIVALVINLNSRKLPYNEDILYLTSSVHSMTGVVQKIEGNDILLTATLKAKTEKEVVEKKVTYRIHVIDKTTISRTALPSTQFSFPRIPETNLRITDIQAGQTITVETTSDLRLIKVNEFDAVTIALTQRMFTTKIRVVSVNENKITGKMYALAKQPSDTNPLPQEDSKEYVIEINKDTQIEQSLLPPVNGQRSKTITISEIKPDDMIAILSKEDANATTTLTALRIQKAPVMPTVTIPVPQPTR